MRRTIVIGVLGFCSLAFVPPAGAHEPAPPSSGAFLGGIVQESDVGLMFDYLRHALQAAIEGREPPPPDEQIVQRAEAIGQEVKRRGAAAARAVIDAIEQSVREGMREPRRALPETRPYQPI